MSGSIEAAISRVATRTGVNRNALERLVWNESRGNASIGWNKGGPHYSAGIAQVSRGVWETYSNLPYSQALNPKMYEYNIEVGAKYLKHNYQHYGTWRIALAAYNEGETITNRVLKGEREFSPITKNYISGVQN